MYMPRGEYYFKPPKFVQRFLERNLHDLRDMEIAYLFFNIMTTQYPAIIALFMLPPSHILGAAYLVVFNVLYMQRFILGMHYSTHKRLFKRGAFARLGIHQPLQHRPRRARVRHPCNTYWLHHVVMHHVDNNEWNKDLSATEAYQSDNILHWIVYWVRFMVGAGSSCRTTRSRSAAGISSRGAPAGCTRSVAMYLYLHALNPIAAFWTVAMPFLVVSTALMFGNWSQHAFVKPDDPRCNFGLAYTVVNHPDNQRSFNDGFHTLHHVNSQIHWSEFPNKFVEKLDEHAEKDALVFDGIGFFDAGFALCSSTATGSSLTLREHRAEEAHPRRGDRPAQGAPRAAEVRQGVKEGEVRRAKK